MNSLGSTLDGLMEGKLGGMNPKRAMKKLSTRNLD